VRHGNQVRPFGAALAYGNFMHGTKDFRIVVAISAAVTDSDGDVLQDNEAALMLEGLPLNGS
jgi:hypothetical protein